MEKGTVYWITGLSGAGKTTIGKALYNEIKKERDNVVLLDGDVLRETFGNDLGYTKEDRFQCAMRYGRICRMLSEQDITVICCTISMFNEVREWNRGHIENYVEVYLRVPIEILKQRDQKQLYSGIKNGTSMDVVGMDLELELPEHSEIVIDNTGEKSIEDTVEEIMAYRK
ncbi:MAG: adenylyl-sulfate kinase [Lachnospiraceae bacterium]|nr:adenylyl-sulfate kinase [Lachnospiraceae bacterium]MBD5483051.1 adenylyl-sulfate kinase [Lachnospiraceae bacterium]